MPEDRPSFTAEWVALIRAAEQRLPIQKRVVDDPYAGEFLARAGSALAWRGVDGPIGRVAAAIFGAPPLWFSQSVLVRHRVFDDLLLEEAAEGATQLVILGAGYDARAYRFAPERGGPPRAFEVDRPALSALKRRIVAEALAGPPAHVRFVPVDFLCERLADRLLAEGFQRGARTVFVWEGVTMYLTREAIGGTLRAMREIAGPGSVVCFDVLRRPAGLSPYAVGARLFPRVFLRAIGEPLLFWFDETGEQPLDLIRAEGWEPLFHRRAGDLQAILDRISPGRGRVAPQIELLAARAL